MQEKDVYGNEVQRLGRPLPVEYLLVDVPASTPLVPLYTFLERKDAKQYFPVENRMIDGHIQDFAALANYLAKSRSLPFLDVSVLGVENALIAPFLFYYIQYQS